MHPTIVGTSMSMDVLLTVCHGASSINCPPAAAPSHPAKRLKVWTYQRSREVRSCSTYKVHKDVIDDVRPHLCVTLATKSELHEASVAQVPASVTMSRQSPTTTAQCRRPLVAASKSIQAAHLPPVSPKKAAARSVLMVPSGQPQLASTVFKHLPTAALSAD